MPATGRGDERSYDKKLRRARTLLVEALAILDSDEEFPELGARLQGVIDGIDERSPH